MSERQYAEWNAPHEPTLDRSPDIVATAFLRAVESDLSVAASVGGIHGVLACLNARTRYRFTGIHPVPGGTGSPLACLAYLYDRETPSVLNPDHTDLRRVSIGIVHSEPSLDAANRHWTDCFPAWSCLGTPLTGDDGATWGILCHFDHRLRTAPPSEAALLRYLGSRAGRWLEVTQSA